MADNLIKFVSELGPTSPFRRPLIAISSFGIDIKVIIHFILCFNCLKDYVLLFLRQEAAKFFGVTKETVRKAKSEESNILHEIKYPPNTKRKRISQQKIQEAEEFIDTTIPIVSGRDYRLLSTTEKKMYENYTKECEEPLSKSFFVHKVLRNFRYHHVNQPSSCPYCANVAQSSKKGSGDG